MALKFDLCSLLPENKLPAAVGRLLFARSCQGGALPVWDGSDAGGVTVTLGCVSACPVGAGCFLFSLVWGSRHFSILSICIFKCNFLE